MDRKESDNQMEILVETIERNPKMASTNPTSSLKQEELDSFWKNLAETLNRKGPLIRHASGWLKVWRDCKYAVIKKCQRQRTTAHGSDSVAMTDLENRVARILGQEIVPKRSRCSGQTSSAPSTKTSNKMTESGDTADEAESTRSDGKRKRSTEEIEDDNKESSKKPKTIEETLLREREETQRHMRRLTGIQEECAQIEKANLEEKRKFRYELAKLKAQKTALLIKQIEIKQRKLDAL